MTRPEQEFHVIDNRAADRLLVESTHPPWTRKLELLERRGLARRTRTITAVENGKREILGGEWEIDRKVVALRLTPRRKASAAQKEAAAKAAAARLGRKTNARPLIQTARSRKPTGWAAPDELTAESTAPRKEPPPGLPGSTASRPWRRR